MDITLKTVRGGVERNVTLHYDRGGLSLLGALAHNTEVVITKTLVHNLGVMLDQWEFDNSRRIVCAACGDINYTPYEDDNCLECGNPLN